MKSIAVVLLATSILIGCGEQKHEVSEMTRITGLICHDAVNPENQQYTPGTRGAVHYKIRMQSCMEKWRDMFNKSPEFYAREKSAHVGRVFVMP